MARQFPEPGDLFENRFRIRESVGSGGFARIFHAIQTDLNRDVALKVLEPQQLHDPTSPDETTRKAHNRIERFRREARNVSQLRDSHTITLFDYGQTDDGLLYMVFEYIDGADLKDVSEHEAPIASERVVDILRQVLESLQEAHTKGMLHRDIKPANIMVYDHVGRSDQVKVLDFGIAKAVLEHADKTVQDLTREGMMLGTPRYMSPEQLRGEDIGPPSDLYSLGLVAYELLAGRKAIEADSTMTIISRQVGPAPIILPFDADVPDILRATIHRMVAKDRNERFQSTQSVLEALELWNAETRPGWAKSWIFSDQEATTQERRPEESQQASVKTSPMRRPPDDRSDEGDGYRTESPGDDSTTVTELTEPHYDEASGPEDPTHPDEPPPTDDAMAIPEDARTIPSMNLPDSLQQLREDNDDGGGSASDRQSNRPADRPSDEETDGSSFSLSLNTSDNPRQLVIVGIVALGIVIMALVGFIAFSSDTPTVVPEPSTDSQPDGGRAP